MKIKAWIPAFAGMTFAFAGMTMAAGMTMSLTALAADSILGKKTGEPEFLPVDQAFEIQPLEAHKGGKLAMGWRIAKGYYLYRDRMKFTLTAPSGAKLGDAALPKGEKHDDEHFGPTVIYRGLLNVELPVTAPKGPYTLTVQYQGCADAGLCYPPQTRTLELAR